MAELYANHVIRKKQKEFATILAQLLQKTTNEPNN